MTDEIEIEIGTDGTLRTIYKDDNIDNLRTLIGAEITNVQRASNVEWNAEGKGWTVRSAHDPELAIRYTAHPDPMDREWCNNPFAVSKTGALAVFAYRDSALAWEQRLFWNLLPPKERCDDE